MNTYSIDSDSPRWWWPSAAAGAVGAAAITAILVLPATGSGIQGGTTPEDARPRIVDPWFATVDPTVPRQCFALAPRWNAALDHGQPRCGQRPAQQDRTVAPHPHLDSGP